MSNKNSKKIINELLEEIKIQPQNKNPSGSVEEEARKAAEEQKRKAEEQKRKAEEKRKA